MSGSLTAAAKIITVRDPYALQLKIALVVAIILACVLVLAGIKYLSQQRLKVVPSELVTRRLAEAQAQIDANSAEVSQLRAERDGLYAALTAAYDAAGMAAPADLVTTSPGLRLVKDEGA